MNQFIFDVFSYRVDKEQFLRYYCIDPNGICTYVDVQTKISGFGFDSSGKIEFFNPITKENEKVSPLYGKKLWEAKKSGQLLNELPSVVQYALDHGYRPAKIGDMTKNPSLNEYIELLSTIQIKSLTLDIETDVETSQITMIGTKYVPENKYVLYINTKFFPDIHSEKTESIKIIADTEENILKQASKAIFELNKRVLVSFNGMNFDIPVLLARCKAHGVVTWFDVAKSEWFSKFGYTNAPHLDLYRIFSNNSLKLYMFGNVYEKESLDAVSEALLGVKKLKIDFKSCSSQELITYNARDLDLTQNLFDLIIKALLFMSYAYYTPIYEFQTRTIATWVENLLCARYHSAGILIYPKKHEISEDSEEKTGGLVITPPTGIFRNVDVLDVASMYPTIVAEYNLGSETINCRHEECKSNMMPGFDLKIEESGADCLDVKEEYDKMHVCTKCESVLAKCIREVRDFRVNVAKPMSKKDKTFKFISGACKVFMNGTAGLIGSAFFRFSDASVFNAITRCGQFTLYSTIRYIHRVYSEYIRIIYGATDSIFLIFSGDESKKKDIFVDIIEYVKKNHKMDIEFEKTFKILFFSGRKSNYIGIKKDNTEEIKGVMLKKSSVPAWFRENFTQFIEKVKEWQTLPDDQLRNSMIEFIEQGEKVLRHPQDLYEGLHPFVYEGKFNSKEYKSKPQHIVAAELDMKKNKIKYVDGDSVQYFKAIGDYSALPLSMYRKDLVDIKKYIELYNSSYSQILESILDKKQMKKQKTLEKFDEILGVASKSEPKTDIKKECVEICKKKKTLIDFL